MDDTRPPRSLWAVDVGWDAPQRSRRSAAVRRRRRLEARYRRRRAVALLVIGALLALLFAVARPGHHAAPSRSAPPPAPVPEQVVVRATTPIVPVRPGEHGQPVAGLQTALAQLGVYAGAADGTYGHGTRVAVAKFQHSHGIAAGGTADAATVRGLGRALVRGATTDAATVQAGVAAAARSGRIPRGDAAADNAALGRAVTEVGRVRLGAAAALAAVVRDVAAQAGALDAPRARALFGMLAANTGRFASAGLPRPLASFQRDGIVYRYFPGHGYQFHPLATFGALDAAVAAGRKGAARRIADAMIARAVPLGRARVWEYYFPFGGPARWTSGFAQAAGADALARAGTLLGDQRLMRAAKSAFAAIPAAYLHPIAGGEWIKEYSFGSLLILNAQLQTFLLVSDYADRSGDPAAPRLAAQLGTAAHRLLPRFDTGCWSRYSLGGAPASPHYHAYHVSLLRRIARLTGDPSWGVVAARWQGYERHGGCPSG